MASNRTGGAVGGQAAELLASQLAVDLPPDLLADRLAGLQVLTSALLQARDVSAVTDAVLETGLPALRADEAWVCLLDPTGDFFDVVAATAAVSESVETWRRFPRNASTPAGDSLDRNDVVVWESLDERDRAYPALRGTEVAQAYVVAPMAVNGNEVGALAFGYAQARRIDTADRTFVRAAADQATQALLRARLLAEEQRAHRWQRFLSEASLLLSGTLYSDDLLLQVADLAVPTLADGCVLHLAEEASEEVQLRTVAASHADPQRRQQLDELVSLQPVARNPYILEVAASGESLLLPTITDEVLERSTGGGEHQQLVSQLGVTSGLCVALIAHGRTLGTLTLLSNDADNPLGEAHLAAAEDLAARAALAIDNARLYDRERRFAETLQRSMLPSRFPHTEGVICAGRYRPASQLHAVGGDWYAVTPLDDGRVGLAVGDVAGHGPAAATAMGTMRNGLRALTTAIAGPAEVLDALNRFVCTYLPDDMATVAYLVLDPARATVTYANAGHLPPLVCHPSGGTRYLKDALQPPIGVDPDISYTEASSSIADGSTLVLYTDGLIERRDAPIDFGLENLRRACEGHAAPPPARCDYLLDELIGDEPLCDDVALLVADLAARQADS